LGALAIVRADVARLFALSGWVLYGAAACRVCAPGGGTYFPCFTSRLQEFPSSRRVIEVKKPAGD